MSFPFIVAIICPSDKSVENASAPTSRRSHERQSIAILKIDVESFEPQVIAGAKRLLQSGMVENILMEASGSSGREDLHEMLLTIMHAGYQLHQIGKAKGPVNAIPANYKTMSMEELAQDLIQRLLKLKLPSRPHLGLNQLNFWWKYQGNRTPTPTTTTANH